MHNAAMVARSLGSRCLCHGDSDTARDTGRARGLQEISIDQLLKLALFMWFPGNASNESSSHPSGVTCCRRLDAKHLACSFQVGFKLECLR